MNEELTPDPDFVKGFNEGYTLAKHLPELAEQLDKISSSSERMAGFKAGRDEFIYEKINERMPEWLKDEPSKEWQPDLFKDNRGTEPEKE